MVLIIQIEKNMTLRILPYILPFLLLLPFGFAISSASPVWTASSYFKAGAFTFAFSSATATSQNSTITYASALVNSTLKVPTMGITDLNYLISGGRVYVMIQVLKYTTSALIFNVQVNQNNCLSMLKLTYMTLDNSFTPAFSMNYFFPTLNKQGPNINVQYFVNFSSSTGVTLNTQHVNVLLPFMHYIDLTTSDNTVDLNLDFTLINSSFYSVAIRSTSTMYLRYAGFSRLIFDKTAIEAMGNDYFDYGIVTSLNSNAATLSTTIPNGILPSNLFFGMHSFNIQTGLSQINFLSSYDINSGVIGLTPGGSFGYAFMKFSYLHHKSRVCPAGFPYYNITELLCYTACAQRWFVAASNMTCNPCLYTCATCTSSSACTSCDAAQNRVLSSNQCEPMPGYFDTGSGSALADACVSPCATCSGVASNCLTCGVGYYTNGGGESSCALCSDAIPFCTACSGPTFCTLCQDGTSGASCTSCPYSYYLAADGVSCLSCSDVSAYCQSCTATQCTYCGSSFVLANNSCGCRASQFVLSNVCTTCSTVINYCYSCSDANTCTACANNFVLNSPTSCSCDSNSYLTAGTCRSCSLLAAYCMTCTSSGCSACLPSTPAFSLANNSCLCPSGYYANANSFDCQTCDSAMPGCDVCRSGSNCTTCAAGYKLTLNGGCEVQLCSLVSCYVCSGSFSVCESCYSGYSVGADGASCVSFCGDGALQNPPEQCDDGNTVSGDGCSSTCTLETGFRCFDQVVNITNKYSWCLYTATIPFSSVWIRKFEGNNSLKFEFQLGLSLAHWASVDFTAVVGIDTADPATNSSTGMGSAMVSSYSGGYHGGNRFWVIVNYENYPMEGQYLVFSLNPYTHNAYPSFSVPANFQFNPPLSGCYVSVTANNNQNANVYSAYQYGLYQVSETCTYIVVGLSFLGIFLSLLFRSGRVIMFEMVAVMQITYFSLAFIDSMNPVFSGLLPLRFLAGMFTFQTVDSYLEELSQPNAMKGIYMYYSFAENFGPLAVALFCVLVVGLIMYIAYRIYDRVTYNPDIEVEKAVSERRSYLLFRVAINIIGEVTLGLLFFILPLYAMSLFFQIFFALGSVDFLSYVEGVGVGVVLLVYFIILMKADFPKLKEISLLGQFISELNCASIFYRFKYYNLQIVQILGVSGLVMFTIYSNSRQYSSICIIVAAAVDVLLVLIFKPYRFGFVSCCRGKDSLQARFQKIQLFKIEEDIESPKDIKVEFTQKSQQDENNSEVLMKSTISPIGLKSEKTVFQNEKQAVSQPTIILFNNNTRRIINLLTLIFGQFIFICARSYSAQLAVSQSAATSLVILPLYLHILLMMNLAYNYFMLTLNIMNRTRQDRPKVQVMPESGMQLKKWATSNASKLKDKTVTKISKGTAIDLQTSRVQNSNNNNNRLIIKSTVKVAESQDLSRPHIIKTNGKIRRYKRGQTSAAVQIVLPQ